MAPSAWFALLILSVAGCASLPAGPSAPPATVAAPVSRAPDAVQQVVGSALFLTWNGSFSPGANPVSAPLPVSPPVARNAPPPKEFAFTFPPEVKLMRVWLNWSDPAAHLGLAITNETGRRHCGDLSGGDEGKAACLATYYLPHEGTKDFKATAMLFNAAKPVTFTLTLALSAAPLPILGSPAPAGSFSTPTLVSADRHSGEPSIAVTPKGTIYVAFPTGAQEALYRSTDNGATFSFVAIHNSPTSDPGSLYDFGGGDSDVATFGDSTVYFADQQGGSGETVSASHDGGKTWFTQPLSAGPAPTPAPGPAPRFSVPAFSADRQWLVTNGDLGVWMAFNSAQGATVVRSLDGGRSWPGRAFMAEDDCFRGNLARAPDGTLYFAGCNAQGPGVGVSTDGGLSFTWHLVAKRDGKTNTSFIFPAHIFIVATTDAAGNAYVVWSDEAQTPDATGAPQGSSQGLNVWLSSSTDKGSHWSKPKKVNQLPGTYVEPWATGGAKGQVAVAYYGTKFAGNPEQAIADWYPIVATTTDATADAPAWREASMSADLVQYGPICMRGSACGNARNLLDFFQIQADKDGVLHATFVDGRAGVNARLSNIMYAHSKGPLLGGPSVDKSGGALVEPPLS